MISYQKRYINTEGSYQIWQIDGDNETHIKSELQSDYAAWLAEGNTPEEIVYTAPAPIPLEIYKANKIEVIKNETAIRCADLTVYRDPDIAEKLTDDVRESLHARYSELIMLTTQRTLTSDEQAAVAYLQTIWDSIKTIQQYEFGLVKQVQNAITHAEVDSIEWIDDDIPLSI